MQILLATGFGIGSTTNAITWATYEAIAARPEVAWAVPVALGDTHAGFPVVGTTPAYFARYRYGRDRALAFSEGGTFGDEAGAVIGAEVAASLGYGIESVIVNAHGAGQVSLDVHDEAPFTVHGVLAQTGTPIDRMVFVSLAGFAAIHAPHAARPVDPLAALEALPAARGVSGTHAEVSSLLAAGHSDHTQDHAHAAEGSSINAIYVGLVAPEAVLSFQRAVADYDAEPLTGVLPAATLLRLWSITSVAESALRGVALAVVVAGLLGMVVMLSATLDARRREFAILRSVGATPAHVAGLVLMEAAFVALAGIGVGLVVLAIAAAIVGSSLSDGVGLTLAHAPQSGREYAILAAIALAALLASLVPAWRVFRHTLADGLSIRL